MAHNVCPCDMVHTLLARTNIKLKATWAIGSIRKILQLEFALAFLLTWGKISLWWKILMLFKHKYNSDLGWSAKSFLYQGYGYLVFRLSNFYIYFAYWICPRNHWKVQITNPNGSRVIYISMYLIFQWPTVNVYLRQQKLHDIKVSKAKMTIEEKETVSLCILSYKNTV